LFPLKTCGDYCFTSLIIWDNSFCFYYGFSKWVKV